MSIKSSPLYLIAGCASAFMLGSYCVTYFYGEGAHAASPSTVPDFDIDRFGESWYTVLMTADLPWNTDSYTCA